LEHNDHALTYVGRTDDSTWNGWPNITVTRATFDRIVEELRDSGDVDGADAVLETCQHEDRAYVSLEGICVGLVEYPEMSSRDLMEAIDRAIKWNDDGDMVDLWCWALFDRGADPAVDAWKAKTVPGPVGGLYTQTSGASYYLCRCVTMGGA